MEILKKVYEIYKEDLQTEDKPSINPEADFKEGDIVELDGNIYVFLWKSTDYGYLGLLATPYTLLAHPTHPKVKADGLLYDKFAIMDIYLPLTERVIRRHITDTIEVLEDRKTLSESIEKSLKEEKIYHPIREQFVRDEIRRTKFLIEETLREIEKAEETEKEIPKKGIVIKIPKELLKKVETPQRLAAESEQQTAENEHFLIVKHDNNSFSLIVKNPNLLGRKVKILFGENNVIFEDILTADTLIMEIDGNISPTTLADLLKVEDV